MALTGLGPVENTATVSGDVSREAADSIAHFPSFPSPAPRPSVHAGWLLSCSLQTWKRYAAGSVSGSFLGGAPCHPWRQHQVWKEIFLHGNIELSEGFFNFCPAFGRSDGRVRWLPHQQCNTAGVLGSVWGHSSPVSWDLTGHSVQRGLPWDLVPCLSASHGWPAGRSLCRSHVKLTGSLGAHVWPRVGKEYLNWEIRKLQCCFAVFRMILLTRIKKKCGLILHES